MADFPETTVFRNDYEAGSNIIAMYLQSLGRFGYSQNYDYSDPTRLTVTCREQSGGPTLVFVLTATRADATYIDKALPKAVAAFDRGQ